MINFFYLAAVVAGGAFLGGLLRWTFASIIGGFRATLTSNVTACIIAGVILGSPWSGMTAILVVTGFCGALSTWSTLAKELGEMITERKWGLFSGYLTATLGGGIAGVLAGQLFSTYITG